jgi:hypothetical protein
MFTDANSRHHAVDSTAVMFTGHYDSHYDAPCAKSTHVTRTDTLPIIAAKLTTLYSAVVHRVLSMFACQAG